MPSCAKKKNPKEREEEKKKKDKKKDKKDKKSSHQKKPKKEKPSSSKPAKKPPLVQPEQRRSQPAYQSNPLPEPALPETPVYRSHKKSQPKKSTDQKPRHKPSDTPSASSGPLDLRSPLQVPSLKAVESKPSKKGNSTKAGSKEQPKKYEGLADSKRKTAAAEMEEDLNTPPPEPIVKKKTMPPSKPTQQKPPKAQKSKSRSEKKLSSHSDRRKDKKKEKPKEKSQSHRSSSSSRRKHKSKKSNRNQTDQQPKSNKSDRKAAYDRETFHKKVLALNLNVNEVLRIGSVLERFGVDAERRKAFEWLAEKRGSLELDTNETSHKLLVAIGDLPLSKALAVESIRFLVSLGFVTETEFEQNFSIIERSPAEQHITIAQLAHLLNAYADHYRNH